MGRLKTGLPTDIGVDPIMTQPFSFTVELDEYARTIAQGKGYGAQASVAGIPCLHRVQSEASFLDTHADWY